MEDSLIARSMGINKKLDEFRLYFFLPYPSAMPRSDTFRRFSYLATFFIHLVLRKCQWKSVNLYCQIIRYFVDLHGLCSFSWRHQKISSGFKCVFRVTSSKSKISNRYLIYVRKESSERKKKLKQKFSNSKPFNLEPVTVVLNVFISQLVTCKGSCLLTRNPQRELVTWTFITIHFPAKG